VDTTLERCSGPGLCKSRSVRLGARELDDLGSLLSFVGEELSKSAGEPVMIVPKRRFVPEAAMAPFCPDANVM
jgi:hypothetical protein